MWRPAITPSSSCSGARTCTAPGPAPASVPHTDYDTQNCTGGNCDRRAALSEGGQRPPGQRPRRNGRQLAGPTARRARTLLDGEPNAGLIAILTGMGSLSYGELAGERMKLGLLLHDPEEEHDCFSDNTHISHLYDAIGIRAAYLGRYKRLDGGVVEGPSAADMVKKADPAIDRELSGKLDTTVAKMEAIQARARRRRGLRPADRRGQSGRQRHRPGGDRRADRPDQVDRARGRHAQARRHRLRRLRQPRRARQGVPVSCRRSAADAAWPRFQKKEPGFGSGIATDNGCMRVTAWRNGEPRREARLSVPC